MTNPVVYWRDALIRILAESGFDASGINKVLTRYDGLVNHVGVNTEDVFKDMLESYASCDAKTVHEKLKDALDTLNKTHKPITLDSVRRIRRAIQTANKNAAKLLDGCTVILDEKSLSDWQRERLQGAQENFRSMVLIKTPEALRDKTSEFQAKASYQNRQVQLGCVVRYP